MEEREGLVPYPYPPLKYWPNNIFYKKVQSEGIQFPYLGNSKSCWRYNNNGRLAYDKSLTVTNANFDILSVDLDQLHLDHTLDHPNQPDVTMPLSEDKHGSSLRGTNVADHMYVAAGGAVGAVGLALIKKRVAVPDERDTMAVFVHAGAGYHSLQNEHAHLTMCAK